MGGCQENDPAGDAQTAGQAGLMREHGAVMDAASEMLAEIHAGLSDALAEGTDNVEPRPLTT